MTTSDEGIKDFPGLYIAFGFLHISRPLTVIFRQSTVFIPNADSDPSGKTRKLHKNSVEEYAQRWIQMTNRYSCPIFRI